MRESCCYQYEHQHGGQMKTIKSDTRRNPYGLLNLIKALLLQTPMHMLDVTLGEPAVTARLHTVVAQLKTRRLQHQRVSPEPTGKPRKQKTIEIKR